MAQPIDTVRDLISEVRKDLFKKPNVVAIGVGYKVTMGRKTKDLSIICSVEAKKAKKSLTSRELIPTHIQNIPLDVHPMGVLRALQSPDPKKRHRPAPGGSSIGHKLITAGTLGCLVKKDGKVYILSNNHVLANSNDADVDDPLLQPGPSDGGKYPEDHIANLSDFVPIEFEELLGACPISTHVAGVLNHITTTLGHATILQAVKKEGVENLADCAIAEPLKEDDVINEIIGNVKIEGIEEGALDMPVKKSGRTTGVTTGTIEQIDVTARVTYGAHKVGVFVDQFMASPMSEGGDSGSAVVNNDNKIVGLLFAGSNSGTVINRIQNVFEALNVTLF